MPNGKKDWILRVAKTVKQKRKQSILHVAGFDKTQILDQIRMQASERLSEFYNTSTSDSHSSTKNDLNLSSIWDEYTNCVEYRGNTDTTKLQKRYSFNRYSNFWKARGKAKITQITRSDVRAFLNTRKSTPTASNRDLSHLSHFVQFAMNEGYVTENFARNIKRELEAPGSDGIKLHHLEEFYNFLDDYPKIFCQETRSFIMNTNGTFFLDPHKLITANFVKFIILTGVRVSEARYLTYLPRRNCNYVYRSKSPSTGKSALFLKLNRHKTAKNTGPRELELIKSAVDCLSVKPPFRLSQFKYKNTYVFPAKRGLGPISRKTIDAFVDELNLRFKDFDNNKKITLRSLRHTFSRYALDRGLTHDELASILGHSDTSMIRKYYARPDLAQVSHAIHKLHQNLNSTD